jgi:phosphohistidine phosphatase
MIVTFIRHGEAGLAATDRERELTGRGEDDISYGAHQLNVLCGQRQLPTPDRIVHSPYLRTTQTAQILASAFSHAAVDTAEALLSEAQAAGVDPLIEAVLAGGEVGHLALVTHQPLVSRVIARYLGDERVPGLPPGGLCCLHLDVAAPACAELAFWALPPAYEVGS